MSTQSSPLKMYFGYGSNLVLEQMSHRCPFSNYVGVGRLAGFRWIISGRGYANVVPSDKPHSFVYGLVYNLTPDDESALDTNEGVPYAYTKEMMAVEFWESPKKISDNSRSCWEKIDVTKPGETRQLLIYIDRQRTQNDQPKAEYIHRMNKGIADAVTLGVPPEYVEKHIRPFIPLTADKGSEEMAKKQAMKFTEEEDC